MAIKNRRSIRLPQYDYAWPGAYFVTINTARKVKLFGELKAEHVELNQLGLIASKCWQEIPEHFSNIVLDAFIVMPNHVHGILVLEDPDQASLLSASKADCLAVGATHASPLRKLRRPRGPGRGSIAAIIGSYKSAVTRAINDARSIPRASVWQRNYYERVLRDDRELDAARHYVTYNNASKSLPFSLL